MSPALGGAGRANFALRVALLSLASVVVGCSANPASGALKVEVLLEAGLISRCVKVTATDGVLSRETKAIPLAGKSSPLNVGVTADGMTQPVTVQALGYSDEACTTRAPGEESEKKDGNFTNPPSTVTLTLRPAANNDGGTDGGNDGGNDGGTDAGVDGGLDAGVDMDMDGFPLPVDCDDTDPLIHPGAAESCNDGIDNNCDNQTDCQANSCSTMGCSGGGTCMGNFCVALTESVCNDGMDNNNNGLVDCADPDCPVNQICSDNNACTTGDRCVVNPDGGAGLCQKVGDFACSTPPAAQCWAMTGTCVADGGATCLYTQMAGSCNDSLGCTDNDTCSNGTCAGTQKTCMSPPNSCFQMAGTCQEPAGTCAYTAVAAGTVTCNDNNNCTIGDSCAGDGGCAGTQVQCAAPNQCQNASTSCDTGGNCLYAPRTGQTCDAGTGAGTCDGTAACNANPVTLFPYTPSNFTEGQLPADGGTTGFTVSCATTLSTSGTPSITSGACVTMPAFTLITQGGESTVLIRVPSFAVNATHTLTITGTRPVIFAVTGNVQIDGTIRANNMGNPAPTACGNGGNGAGASPRGGGGGGGFGTFGGAGGIREAGGAGADGGVNGTPTLIPLRSGCNGGNGSGSAGSAGAGGGAIQIAAGGSLTVSSTGIVTAPGQGGAGATGTDTSGGGGGSGGAILLEAFSVLLDNGSWVTANGGGGGGGEDGAAGGNGSPGSINSTTAATGGSAQNNGGPGGAGATRTAGAQPGSPTGQNDGAGGGGAGVGRIRINGTTCSLGGTSNRSPAATSNGNPGCP